MADANPILEQHRATMAGLDPSGPPLASFVLRTPSGIRSPGSHLLVLDASYNPPTRAHLKMIELSRSVRPPKEVALMLSRANVDKGVFGAPLEHRLEMLTRCAAGEADVSVVGCSHARFVDKALALRGLYPPGTEVSFIIGYDTLCRLFDDKYYGDIASELDMLFTLCRFVVANRGAVTPGQMRELVRGSAGRKHSHRLDYIRLVEPYASMSSSEVRRRCEKSSPIGDLVEPGVAKAIADLDLYRG